MVNVNCKKAWKTLDPNIVQTCFVVIMVYVERENS